MKNEVISLSLSLLLNLPKDVELIPLRKAGN